MAGLTASRGACPTGGPSLRRLALALLATAMLAAACGVSTTPYNARLSCETVGGRYTADGRCQAGSL